MWKTNTRMFAGNIFYWVFNVAIWKTNIRMFAGNMFC